MRAILVLLVLVLSVFAPAQAQTYTRPAAWAACTSRAADFDAERAAMGQPTGFWCKETVNTAPANTGTVMLHAPPKNLGGEMGIYYAWSGTCPNGGRWNTATNICAPSEAECKAKPNLGRGITTGGSTSTCSGGCEFTPQVLGGGALTVGFPDGAKLTPATAWKASGGMCGATTPPPPPDKDQECRPVGSGQTMCVKPDGQQCASASNGRQVCWRPGETGEKTDGPVLQKRNAGPTEIPPNNLQLPSGDSLQKQGQSVTTTSTTTTSSSTTTSTTTTTNYVTQNGTNAGTEANGESGAGDGSGKEEGDGKGASGGANCESPPVVTGDQVLGMVATQAWQTRCAVEAGNAAKVTGDVSNCAQAFTVEGTNANAVQLRAMRAQLCKGDANGDGQPDWTKPDGTEAGEGGEDEEPGILQRMVNTDLLDTDGFFGGSATCPQLGTLEFGPFGSFSFDSLPWFCDLVALMRGVVLLMGAFISLRILTGEGL